MTGILGHKRKGDFDATTNYCSGAVVRRRRRLLRVFQMGSRGGLGIVGTVLLIVLIVYLARRVALTLFGSI